MNPKPNACCHINPRPNACCHINPKPNACCHINPKPCACCHTNPKPYACCHINPKPNATDKKPVREYLSVRFAEATWIYQNGCFDDYLLSIRSWFCSHYHTEGSNHKTSLMSSVIASCLRTAHALILSAGLPSGSSCWLQLQTC